jgi:adenylyltransferase/sulfurtransferase
MEEAAAAAAAAEGGGRSGAEGAEIATPAAAATAAEVRRRLAEIEEERTGLLLRLSSLLRQEQREHQEQQQQRRSAERNGGAADGSENGAGAQDDDDDGSGNGSGYGYASPLSRDQIERYSRPVLAGLGAWGQSALLRSKVLVVGAGGIGCPCLLYLAGAGVGKLGVADPDRVEASNLHRQVAFTVGQVGGSKAEAARAAALALNPTIECVCHPLELDHDNALDILGRYDVVVDATDNPRTRYLINDACSLLARERGRRRRALCDDDGAAENGGGGRTEIPVVFASAVGAEAQITVFVHGGGGGEHEPDRRRGGCYRCLYPDPGGPAAAACASCSDAGVLGPAPGVVGALQAMEVIKLVAGVGEPLASHVLHYDALAGRFLRLRKPPRREGCPACGGGGDDRPDRPPRGAAAAASTPPAAAPGAFRIRCIDDSRDDLRAARGPGSSAAQACPAAPTSPRAGNLSAREYLEMMSRRGGGPPPLLLDVRDEAQYGLCRLPGSVSAPLRRLPGLLDRLLAPRGAPAAASGAGGALGPPGGDRDAALVALGRALGAGRADPAAAPADICCICRRGVASASAAALIAERLAALEAAAGGGGEDDEDDDGQGHRAKVRVWNILGGLDAWREQVDPEFPKY